MGWTNWRLIADKASYYYDSLDHVGPACYELSIAGPRGGNRRIVYVGETLNEKSRIATYARNGSHIGDIINKHLKDGWTLWYRGWACESKAAAVAMQNRLLKKNKYDWNIQGN
jgi:hypothetical protein